MKYTSPARWLLLLGLALILLAAPAQPRAAELPGGKAIDDLELTRDHVVRVDGEEIENAAVYASRAALAELFIVEGLPALLISPRGRSVQTVDLEAVHREGEGATLEAGVARPAGEYEKRLGTRRFEIDGHAIEISERPPLLGRQPRRTVEKRHPVFSRKARAGVAKNAAAPSFAWPDEAVRIRVYFASWSPICERLVPKIMALESSLAGRVSFEYYGLPQPLDADPVVRQESIHGVPTMVVHVGGQEIGRAAGRELDDPGAALARLLGER